MAKRKKMRPKYHFLTTSQTSSGKHLHAIAGQTFGRTAVNPDILIKDVKGSTTVKNKRRKARPGEIFFTTTLKPSAGCYTATDIYPLSESDENILFSDARAEYDKLHGRREKSTE